jgi:hypothetical protein
MGAWLRGGLFLTGHRTPVKTGKHGGRETGKHGYRPGSRFGSYRLERFIGSQVKVTQGNRETWRPGSQDTGRVVELLRVNSAYIETGRQANQGAGITGTMWKFRGAV